MPHRDLTDPSRSLYEGGDLEADLKAPLFDNVVIPEDFGPVEVHVDDHKVKRFAFTQDDFEPCPFIAGPHGLRIAPAGILANDLLQLFTTRFAASQVVGLHTEEQLWFEAPVLVGSTVTLSGRYVEKYVRRGEGYVVMDAEARDADGRTLLRHRGTEIMRTSPAGVGGRGATGGSATRRVTGEFDTTLPLVDRLGAGVRPGMGLVPLRKEVTAEQMSVFSRIGEFVTNIHNDLRTARQAGLAVPIVQGQQLVCHLAELLRRSFHLSWFSGGSLHVKFLRPVNAFDTIEVQGVVQSVSAGYSRIEVQLDVWVRRGDGTLAAVGWANGGVPPDQSAIALLPR